MSEFADQTQHWLDLALTGDRTAFAELVKLHQSTVRNQLRRLTKSDVELADDLAQDTFIEAWRHLAEFRGQARFASWLYRIAYHRFLMHARSHRSTEVLTEEIEQAEQFEHPNLTKQLDIEMALGQLPEAERVALIHCYYLDLSHDEAAQVLNLPLGTIKSHILRGKARLRELLAAWAPEFYIMNSFPKDSQDTENNTDWLESMLREVPMETIADDGFSARVMQQLPAEIASINIHLPEELRRISQQNRRFECFSLIGAIVGSAIAALGNDWPNPDEIATNIAALIELKPVSIDALLPWLMSLLSAAALAFVMHKYYLDDQS